MQVGVLARFLAGELKKASFQLTFGPPMA